MSDTDVEDGKTDDVMDDWADALAEASEAETKTETPPPPAVEPAALDKLIADGAMSIDEDVNLEVILDIPVVISMEVGSTKINIRNLLQLNQGSVIELDRMAGEPLDIKVNGTLIAHGEVVVVNEKFGIRLTDVISPAERVRKLK